MIARFISIDTDLQFINLGRHRWPGTNPHQPNSTERMVGRPYVPKPNAALDGVEFKTGLRSDATMEFDAGAPIPTSGRIALKYPHDNENPIDDLVDLNGFVEGLNRAD